MKKGPIILNLTILLIAAFLILSYLEILPSNPVSEAVNQRIDNLKVTYQKDKEAQEMAEKEALCRSTCNDHYFSTYDYCDENYECQFLPIFWELDNNNYFQLQTFYSPEQYIKGNKYEPNHVNDKNLRIVYEGDHYLLDCPISTPLHPEADEECREIALELDKNLDKLGDLFLFDLDKKNILISSRSIETVQGGKTYSPIDKIVISVYPYNAETIAKGLDGKNSHTSTNRITIISERFDFDTEIKDIFFGNGIGFLKEENTKYEKIYEYKVNSCNYPLLHEFFHIFQQEYKFKSTGKVEGIIYYHEIMADAFEIFYLKPNLCNIDKESYNKFRADVLSHLQSEPDSIMVTGYGRLFTEFREGDKSPKIECRRKVFNIMYQLIIIHQDEFFKDVISYVKVNNVGDDDQFAQFINHLGSDEKYTKELIDAGCLLE